MTAWGRRMTRAALLPAVALLAGCVSPAGVSTSISECTTVSENAVKYINWAQVPEVNIRIRNGEFSPMILRLRQGWPYILRIRNRDHQDRVFKAYEFLSKVAVIQATVGGMDEGYTCIGAITVPARQAAELKLVAVTDGYYEYEDAFLPWPGVLSTSPNGIIIVEERKPRI